MSTVLSGPAADLGLNMRAGVLAALDECNRAGGVHGRQVRLISLDDGYEPAKTAPNMRKLIAEDDVLAVVGNVGTPTAIAAVPIANESQTLFYGAFTGGGVLRRTPPDRYVINYRASYAEETAAIVDALIDQAHLKPGEIGFFTQRDGYGDSGFAGGIAALKRHGLSDESAVPHVRYERNTFAVEKALSDLLLLKTPPKAIIMVGAYGPSAAFIRLARQNALDALFVNVSFVGSESLAKALGQVGDGVVISQVVPHYDSDLPIASEYRAALAADDAKAQPTFGSMEGYVSTRILLRALEKIQGPPTREGLVNALERLGKFDIGLHDELELDKDHHQACHQVWATLLRDGKVVPITWDQLPPSKRGDHE
jgi:ABC-type branched-subunit amino acid transport system substrate-binding protein